MSLSELSTREKIIDATIESIEEDGIQDVTIRKIAEKAQVNVAAVNYHFSSKKNLLRETLKTTLDNLFIDWEELLRKEPFDLKKTLSFILLELLSGQYRFPNITKAHIYDGLIHSNYENEFFRRFGAFLDTFINKLNDHNSGKTGRMKLSIIQLFSACIMPGMLPGLYHAYPDYDLSRPDKQQEYVAFLIEHYIAEFLPQS